MKSILFALFFLVSISAFGQKNYSPVLPKDSTTCNCDEFGPECGTLNNPKLCYSIPLNWPDSLVTDELYYVYLYMFGDSTKMTKMPLYRYRYTVQCPSEDSGVFNLGIAGKIGFAKMKEGNYNFYWVEQGTVQTFECMVDCMETSKAYHLDVRDGKLNWVWSENKKATSK